VIVELSWRVKEAGERGQDEEEGPQSQRDEIVSLEVG